MAVKRMFSQKIVGSDGFLELSPEAQALYFQLGMRTDDDGFIDSARSVCRMVGVGRERLDELVSGGYLLPFEGGLYCFTHWRINNTLRADRYTETVYLAQRATLALDPSGAYFIPDEPPASGFPTERIAAAQAAENFTRASGFPSERLVADRAAEGFTPAPIPTAERIAPAQTTERIAPAANPSTLSISNSSAPIRNVERTAPARAAEGFAPAPAPSIQKPPAPSIPNSTAPISPVPISPVPNSPALWKCGEVDEKGKIYQEFDENRACAEVNEIGNDSHFSEVFNSQNPSFFGQNLGCHSIGQARQGQAEKIKGSSRAIQRGGAGGGMFAQKIVSTPVENRQNSTNFFHSVHSPDAAQTPDSDIISDSGAAFRKVELPCTADEEISFSNGSFCPADEGKLFSKGALCPADERISSQKGNLYPAPCEEKAINNARYPIRNGNELPSGDSFERNGAHSIYRDSSLRSVVGFQCSAASGGVSAGDGVSLSGAGDVGRSVQLPRSRDEPFPDGFRPPSVAEVRDFCAQSGIRVDARHFCDYYASKNWMTGDTRIKNWRNVVKSWATNGY